MSLSIDSTLKEIFDYVNTPEHEVQVVPVTVSKPEDEIAQLMIIIQGSADTANTIMANLMTAVQEMHDLSEQEAANDDPKPKLVGSDGELLGDDPKVLVPKT